MLSQFEYQQVNNAARPAGSARCNATTQSPAKLICRPFTARLKRPNHVPPCGVPSVNTRCTRPSAWCARSHARTAKPPMLWHNNTGTWPVAAVTLRTASSMMSAYSSI